MIIYLCIIIVMSLFTYTLYIADKKKAKRGQWRTKESYLLLSSVLFGAIGGTIAMYQHHHKTNHWYFIVINWTCIILQIVIGFLILDNQIFSSL